MPEKTSTTVEAGVCVQAQGIDNDGGVGRERRARGLSNNNRGIGRGQGIDKFSEGSETTTEAAGAQCQDQQIYDNNVGVVRGR